MIEALGLSYLPGGVFPQRHDLTVDRAEQFTLAAIFAAS
jgi:hypothetical protein